MEQFLLIPMKTVQFFSLITSELSYMNQLNLTVRDR